MDEGDGALAETFIDVVRILNPRNIVENAIAGTASTLALIRMLGGSSDVLCATPLMGRLLFIGAPDPPSSFACTRSRARMFRTSTFSALQTS